MIGIRSCVVYTQMDVDNDSRGYDGEGAESSLGLASSGRLIAHAPS